MNSKFVFHDCNHCNLLSIQNNTVLPNYRSVAVNEAEWIMVPLVSSFFQLRQDCYDPIVLNGIEFCTFAKEMM